MAEELLEKVIMLFDIEEKLVSRSWISCLKILQRFRNGDRQRYLLSWCCFLHFILQNCRFLETYNFLLLFSLLLEHADLSFPDNYSLRRDIKLILLACDRYQMIGRHHASKSLRNADWQLPFWLIVPYFSRNFCTNLIVLEEWKDFIL